MKRHRKSIMFMLLAPQIFSIFWLHRIETRFDSKMQRVQDTLEQRLIAEGMPSKQVDAVVYAVSDIGYYVSSYVRDVEFTLTLLILVLTAFVLDSSQENRLVESAKPNNSLNRSAN